MQVIKLLSGAFEINFQGETGEWKQVNYLDLIGPERKDQQLIY